MPRGPTKKAIKAAAAVEYQARVESALMAAHAAAQSAADVLINSGSANLARYGNANIVIYKPSYRFRRTLQLMGELEPDQRGAWWVSDFTKNVPLQSLLTNEAAAKAARDVLDEAFPEEPGFFVKTHAT